MGVSETAPPEINGDLGAWTILLGTDLHLWAPGATVIRMFKSHVKMGRGILKTYPKWPHFNFKSGRKCGGS